MKSKIYNFLRVIVVLPRPNEIWGERVENKWNLFTLYLYFKLAVANAMSHVGLVIGVFNTLLLISVKLEQTGAVSSKFLLIGSVIGMICIAIFGHVLIVIGVMKKEASLSNSQNPELQEIKNDVKGILLKLNEKS